MVVIIKALHDAEVRNKEQKTAHKHSTLISSLLTFCFCHILNLISCKPDRMQAIHIKQLKQRFLESIKYEL